jgi:glycosyltransferase involved in cell wall biosynthesis
MIENSSGSNLSVVIITLNEEARIAACLDSLPADAEIIILDSGSTDRTVAIAQDKGARVEFRAFTNYGEQKNAAISLASRPWILSLDADETLTPELRVSIASVTQGDSDAFVGYRLSRKLLFMGRKLRFGKSSDRPLRLFKRGHGQFRSAIHESLDLGSAPIGHLSGELLHYSYADLSDYFTRFNVYTSRIAENHSLRGKPQPPLLLHVLRPWVEFFSRYVLRLGFLDGYPGYTYALISSMYTYVKYAKLRELAQSDTKRGLSR